MSSVVKQLMYVLKLFRVTTGSFHSFQIRSSSRNPPLLWIIWISNPFLDFNKEMKYLFSHQKSRLDLSKEMHPKFREA